MQCPTLAELPKPQTDRPGWPWTEESTRLPATMSDGKPWPKITVVTPHLNQGAFVEETIRSVLLQGYPNIEYILVDGGSTDGSLKLISSYSPWIKCLVHKGEGQSASLNRGFGMAAGELTAWQNSDDFFGPNSFCQAALAAVQNPEYAIFHGMVRGFQGKNSEPPWLFENCHDFSRQQLLEEVCVMNQSMFFRRTIFEHGMRLREDLDFVMDLEFFWRLSLEGFRFCMVPSIIGYYRQHDKAKSTAYSMRADLESYALLRNLCRDKRLDRSLRLRARSQLRERFLNAFVRARRSIVRKLVVELFLPI